MQKCLNQTLAALQNMDAPLLKEKLGEHLSSEEIERILERRDQVVNYFDSVLKKAPALVV